VTPEAGRLAREVGTPYGFFGPKPTGHEVHGQPWAPSPAWVSSGVAHVSVVEQDRAARAAAAINAARSRCEEGLSERWLPRAFGPPPPCDDLLGGVLASLHVAASLPQSWGLGLLQRVDHYPGPGQTLNDTIIAAPS
jgi:hypothetical protein